MQFGRPTAPRAAIDIAPLVDVVFLLVIFFAVSTTFLETAGLKLDLPSSSSTSRREPQALTVLLAADGTLSFAGDVVERAELAQRLRAAIEGGANKLVVLRADRTTQHGDVVAVMDVIRDAGAEALTLAAQPVPGP